MEWSTLNNMELHEDKFEVVSYPLNSSKSLRELPFYPTTLEYGTPKGHIWFAESWLQRAGILGQVKEAQDPVTATKA